LWTYFHLAATRWAKEVILSGVEKLPLSPGERGNYQDAVWEMYAASYRSIGLQAKSPSDLMEFDAWDLFLDEGTPVAFSLSKHTRFGIKGGLLGSDGSSTGKSAIKDWIRSRTKLPGYYVEVSHAVERLSEGAPVVCAAYVPQVLNKPVKPLPDGIHYERVLQGIGTVDQPRLANLGGL
jgi:hypothetical protein